MDVIGDFLTVIRNGVMVAKRSVMLPFSKEKNAIAGILKAEGFILDAVEQPVEGSVRSQLKIRLRYVDGESVIHEIKRVSTPGRRVYKGHRQIKPVIGGLGLSILSTDRGIMSHKKARTLGAGGEVICTVW